MFKPICFLTDSSSLKDPALFEKYFEMMPEERRRKIKSYRFDEDRFECLAAYTLLQKALISIGEDPGDIELIYGENEKPYIKDKNIFFNLSHSEGIAACVLSPYETGCDIECSDTDRLVIAKRKFCREEYELLLSEPDESKRRKLFNRIWTVKESVMKALGTGLLLPLNSFSVSFDSDMVHVSYESIDKTLYFREYPLPYVTASLCCAAFTRDSLPENITFIDL